MKTLRKFTKLSVLLITCFQVLSVFGQVSVPTNAIVTGNFVGSSNAVDVDFKANNSSQAKILQSNGFFGIGTGFSPNFRLDVDAGDININTPTNGLRLVSTAF